MIPLVLDTSIKIHSMKKTYFSSSLCALTNKKFRPTILFDNNPAVMTLKGAYLNSGNSL